MSENVQRAGWLVSRARLILEEILVCRQNGGIEFAVFDEAFSQCLKIIHRALEDTEVLLSKELEERKCSSPSEQG